MSKVPEKALYALLVNATAGDGCEQPPGTTRQVMVIAQGDNEDAAQERALGVLSRFGWVAAEVRRQAPITNDMAEEPGYLRDAIAAALEFGAQIVVYDR